MNCFDRLSQPDTLWAFWAYDQFPYFLSAKITSFDTDGQWVQVEGYTGVRFKPFFIGVNDHGRRIHTLGTRLRYAHETDLELLRNTHRRVAAETLKKLDFPVPAQCLSTSGWNGTEFDEAFRQKLENPR